MGAVIGLFAEPGGQIAPGLPVISYARPLEPYRTDDCATRAVGAAARCRTFKFLDTRATSLGSRPIPVLARHHKNAQRAVAFDGRRWLACQWSRSFDLDEPPVFRARRLMLHDVLGFCHGGSLLRQYALSHALHRLAQLGWRDVFRGRLLERDLWRGVMAILQAEFSRVLAKQPHS